jgi:hypothetical protein
MEDEGRECFISNKVIAPGGPTEMSAYRGEVTGLLAAVFIIHHLCNYFHVTAGTATIGCDGAAALYQAFKAAHRSVDAPSFDLLMAIRYFCRTSVLQWDTCWIRGHQDDKVAFEELDRWSQLNVMADDLAKSMLPIARTRRRHHDTEGAPWAVWHNGDKLSHFTSQIYDIVHSKEAFMYWKKKGLIPPSGIEFINWEAIGRALKALSRPHQHFMSKHMVGICGVGKWVEPQKMRLMSGSVKVEELMIYGIKLSSRLKHGVILYTQTRSLLRQ